MHISFGFHYLKLNYCIISDYQEFINSSANVNKKKKKIEDENRQLQKQREELHFFVQVKGNAICILCRHTITTFKSCNLKRHHEQKHNEIVKLSVNERKGKLRLLKMFFDGLLLKLMQL